MNVSIKCRVISLKPSANPKYPETLIVALDSESENQIQFKVPVSVAKKLAFDGKYKIEGALSASITDQAYGAVRLQLGEGAVVTQIKDDVK